MTALRLSASRIRSGSWEGLFDGGAGEAPRIEVVCRDQTLRDVEVTAAEGRWAARAPIPAALISDGVQTFLVRDLDSGAEIASFSIIAGDAADADLRAELDLLRAELDMLKQAFRRHCLETGG